MHQAAASLLCHHGERRDHETIEDRGEKKPRDEIIAVSIVQMKLGSSGTTNSGGRSLDWAKDGDSGPGQIVSEASMLSGPTLAFGESVEAQRKLSN